MKKILYIWFTLIGLLLLARFGCADTLSELETAVRIQIKDNSSVTASQKYSDTEIDYYLNEGQLKINKALVGQGQLRQRYTIDTVTGTREYDLPDDFLEILGAWIVNEDSTHTYTRLSWTTMDKLDKDVPEWEDADNSEPRDYYIRPTTYSVVIGLYPEPTVDYSDEDYLRIDYLKQFPDMSSDSDYPFNGLAYLNPYHDLLVYWACYKLLGSADYLAIFKDGLKDLLVDMNTHEDKNLRIKYTR